jgi:hypothetical protein
MLASGGTDEMIVDSERSGFRGMEFSVCRLEDVEKGVSRQMILETIFNNIRSVSLER